MSGVEIRWQGPTPTHSPVHPAKVILAEVARKYGLTVDELTGPSRCRHIAHPRQEAMWRMREQIGLSYPQIARRVGLTDHTSAMHGVRAHKARLAEAQKVAA